MSTALRPAPVQQISPERLAELVQGPDSACEMLYTPHWSAVLDAERCGRPVVAILDTRCEHGHDEQARICICHAALATAGRLAPHCFICATKGEQLHRCPAGVIGLRPLWGRS